MYTATPTPILVNASAEPVSLAEAKAHLRVDINDDDALIASLVTAAREWFERATDRQLCNATWRIKLPGFMPCIELPWPPLVSVSSITYLDVAGDEQTLDPSTYTVVTGSTPGYVELAWSQTYPVTYTHPEAVTITYVGGHGDMSGVPELAKQGIKLLLSHWYTHRDDDADVPPAVQAIATALASWRF